MARWMETPRHVQNRRRRTREGPEPACVVSPLARKWHTQEAKGEKHVLPWYRLVGVVSTSSETQGGKAGLPARVSDHHVVRGRRSSPILECAQVTGKAGENGQYSGETGRHAHPGQDRRFQGVVTHSELVLDLGWRSRLI